MKHGILYRIGNKLLQEYILRNLPYQISKKSNKSEVSNFIFGNRKNYKHYNRIISKENIKNILSSYDYYTLHTKSFRKKITLHL